MRSTVKAISDREHGNLGNIIGGESLKPFINSELLLGEAILESTCGKGYYFSTEGIIRKIQQGTQLAVQDNRTFEGWENETTN